MFNNAFTHVCVTCEFNIKFLSYMQSQQSKREKGKWTIWKQSDFKEKNY